MARERTIIRPVNNVLYVEPNYTHSTNEYGKHGLETYELTPDLEDYSIFVNLEIELVGRTINATTSNKTVVLSYTSSGNKETINLMQGSKIPIGDGNYINSLTTNYTDVHLKDMKKVGASPELFGISSIDIAYRNYTVPEVTIEFVDVRGAAVFGQRELYESESVEKAINENYPFNVQNTFFQCFFTFPYPKFRLLVKGFYGEPVSYELTCADFRARFNSDTGNFSCTAKFVGYMFSFLNDVMMNGLIAAPYSDFIGSEYWNQRKFKLRGYDGGEVDTPKLAFLLKELPSKINEAEHIQKNMPEVQEKRNIESIKKELMDLKDLYVSYCHYIVKIASPTVANGDLKILITDTNDDKISNACIILVPSGGKDNSGKKYLDFFNDPNEEIRERIETLIGRDGLEGEISKFNGRHNDKKLPNPDNILTITTRNLLDENENDNTKYVIDKSGKNNDIKEASETLYNAFRDYIDRENNKSGTNVSRYSNYQWGLFYKDNGFYTTLNSYLTEVTEREKEINKKLEDSMKDSLAQMLKFYPTVENMTRIVMAHFETFAYMIFKTGLLIQSESPHRTCHSLGVLTDDITDVPDLSDPEKEIPPFPKVTQIVEKDGLKNREESWVGIYGNKFREVDLVHGILNGIQEANSEKSSGENAGGSGSETSTRSKMKIPLSPLDMVATKAPYGTFNQSEPADFLSLVGLRAIQAIASSNINGWDEKCDVLGRAEAENILATEKISNSLKEKIKDLTAGVVVTMLKGENIEGLKPSSGVWPWKNATDDTGVISSNGDLNICKVKTDGGKTIFTVPYQALNWENIKRDVFSMKSAHSEDYFDVAESDYGKSKKDNIFTLETNLNRFKKIAETQMTGVEGIEYYRDKILKEATYNSSTYSSTTMTSSASNMIANFIEGAENLKPSPKSCMLPCTMNYLEHMELFAGGYDMNYFHTEKPGDGATAFFNLFGSTWTDYAGNEVKRAGGNGFTEFLNDTDTSKHTITEFPGLDENLIPLDGSLVKNTTSLFGEELYYLQDDDNVKAFMFLCSLGKMYNYMSIINNRICSKTETISIIPLASVLYAGGVLWANNNTNKFKYCNPFGSNNINTNCRDNLINKLNNNIKTKLINTFEYFVKTGVKNNSRIVSFNTIRKGLELNLVRGNISYDTFFQSLGEIEENGIFGHKRTWYHEGPFSNRGYEKGLLNFFAGELGDSLFRNYIAVDEDLGGDKSKKTVGLRLGNRDGSVGVVHAVNVGLAPCIFMKNTKFCFKDSHAKVNVDEGKLTNFFDAFLKRLNEEVSEAVADTSIAQANITKTSEDIKIGVYRYCKLLYDKWIGGTKEDEFNKMWTVHALMDENIEDKYFHFIDSYYNKIGQYIFINIGKFCKQVESCYLSDQYSLLSFLSAVYSDNKFNLLCVQNFMDMQKLDNMKKMFDCVPYTSGWNVRKHPNFIVQYPYEPSSHLEYGDSYENDGFMINEKESDKNKWPEALKSRLADANDEYNIPAFGVSYGKMYQSYFRDVDVSMDNPKVTEQTIKAQFAIASLNNDGKGSNDRSDGYTIGQDLFSIYSNNSYTCNVTMMGCAWVQPMMYFVLNNVPMFRGTYMVISVSHRIEQGDMVTKFTGVRMANVNTRIAKDCCVSGINDQSAGGENTNINQESVYESIASTDNDCPYKVFPIDSNSVNGDSSPSMDDISNLQLGKNEWESAKLVVAAFVSMGYTDIAGAAVAGNIMQETHFRNDAVNKMKKANHNPVMKGGVCQWQGARLTRLLKWNLKETDITYTSQPMPPFGRQLMFIDKECKEDSYYKNAYKALKSALTDDKLDNTTELFRKYYEGGSEPQNRINFANEILKEYRKNPIATNTTDKTEISGNGDKHISDLANGFYKALRKTSQSSGANVEIGIDSAKSHDNTLYLTSDSRDFGKVFDMIINAYRDNVSEVRWVVPNGEDQSQPPKYLITTVDSNATSTRIVVTSENDDNAQVSDINIEEQGGMNSDFCKAIVKKYRLGKELINTDLDPDLGPEKIEKLFKIYGKKVEKCNDVASSKDNFDEKSNSENNDNSTGKDSGGSKPTVNSPNGRVKTTSWDADAFATDLHYWQKNVCKAVGKPRKKYGGCSACTGVINRALEDVGLDRKYWSTFPWEVYSKMKSGNDFNEAEHGVCSSKKHFTFSKPLQKGDICLMWCEGNHNSDTTKNHYHSCGYDGSRWVSDFVQNNCNVYTGLFECRMEWHLMRHK